MADVFDYEYTPRETPKVEQPKVAPTSLEYEYKLPADKTAVPVTGYEIEKPPVYPPMGATAKQYESIPSSEVASRALRTIGPSVWEEAKKTIQPFYPSNLPETAQSLGQIGYGLASKAEGAVAPYFGYKQDPEKKAQDEALVDTMKQYYTERYGTEGGIKKAIAEEPASVLSDISLPLTGLGGIARKAPGVLGKTGKIAETAGALATPVVGPAMAGLAGAEMLRDFGLGSIGALGETSASALAEARKATGELNPDFWRSYHGDISDQQLVKDVRSAIAQKAKEKSDSYVAQMQQVTGGSLNPLSYNAVNKALADTSKIYQYGRNKTVIDRPAEAAAKSVETLLQNWQANQGPEYHNIAGFDVLKKQLDKLHGAYKDAGYGDAADKVIGSVRQAVYDTIHKENPEYAKVMEDYQTKQKHIDDLYKELSAGRRSATGTTLRKLIGASKSGRKAELVAELSELDPSLSAKIAGKEVSEAQAAHSGRHGFSKGDIMRTLTGLASAAGAFQIHPLLGVGALAPFATPERAARLASASGIPEIPLRAVKKYAPGAIEKLPMLAYGANILGDVAGEKEKMGIDAQDRGGVARATGGRVMTAERMMSMAKRAKKEIESQTKALLNEPDEHIVKALKVANEHI